MSFLIVQFSSTGNYNVILDESHFTELLMYHLQPPPARSSAEGSLSRMANLRLSPSSDSAFQKQRSVMPSHSLLKQKATRGRGLLRFYHGKGVLRPKTPFPVIKS